MPGNEEVRPQRYTHEGQPLGSSGSLKLRLLHLSAFLNAPDV
jgi:hypothetical protein